LSKPGWYLQPRDIRGHVRGPTSRSSPPVALQDRGKLTTLRLQPGFSLSGRGPRISLISSKSPASVTCHDRVCAQQISWKHDSGLVVEYYHKPYPKFPTAASCRRPRSVRSNSAIDTTLHGIPSPPGDSAARSPSSLSVKVEFSLRPMRRPTLLWSTDPQSHRWTHYPSTRSPPPLRSSLDTNATILYSTTQRSTSSRSESPFTISRNPFCFGVSNAPPSPHSSFAHRPRRQIVSESIVDNLHQFLRHGPSPLTPALDCKVPS